MIRYYVARILGGQLVTYYTGEGRSFGLWADAHGFSSLADAERKARWLGQHAFACAENKPPITWERKP